MKRVLNGLFLVGSILLIALNVIAFRKMNEQEKAENVAAIELNEAQGKLKELNALVNSISQERKGIADAKTGLINLVTALDKYSISLPPEAFPAENSEGVYMQLYNSNPLRTFVWLPKKRRLAVSVTILQLDQDDGPERVTLNTAGWHKVAILDQQDEDTFSIKVNVDNKTIVSKVIEGKIVSKSMTNPGKQHYGRLWKNPASRTISRFLSQQGPEQMTIDYDIKSAEGKIAKTQVFVDIERLAHE